MARLYAVLGALSLAVATVVGSSDVSASLSANNNILTPKHEAGRCAIRGHCGKIGFFGKPLPCVDNGSAEDPDDDLREKLVSVCGAKWNSGPICCDDEQVRCVASVAVRYLVMANSTRSTRFDRISHA